MASKKFKIGQSVSVRKCVRVCEHPIHWTFSDVVEPDRLRSTLNEREQIKLAAWPASVYGTNGDACVDVGMSGIVIAYQNVFMLEKTGISESEYRALSNEQKQLCFSLKYKNSCSSYYRNVEKNYYIVLIDGRKIAFTMPSLLESIDDAIDRHKSVDVVFSGVMRVNNANDDDVAMKIKKRINSLKTIIDDPCVVSISTIERDGSTRSLSMDDEFNVTTDTAQDVAMPQQLDEGVNDEEA